MSCNGKLPDWKYNGPAANSKHYREDNDSTKLPDLDGEYFMDLGSYRRVNVCNVDSNDERNLGRAYFDLGLRHMLSYQHESAAKCFLGALQFSPNCALAHALVALCHSPNYNFKGDAYYESTHHPEESGWPDSRCVFPSQQVADRHSRMAVETVEKIRKMHRKGNGKRWRNVKGKKSNNSSSSESVDTGDGANSDIPIIFTDTEMLIISAVRILTCNPGVDSSLADELVGRPFANAMRKVHEKYPDDPEIAYFFAESLMVLNAWKLFEYPNGKPLSEDVVETRSVLEVALQKHERHAGLCHLYVHLMEMSSEPEKALEYCGPLRNDFKMAGHLIHMPTHIDVLIGDYEKCVRDNCRAAVADSFFMKSSPDTAGTNSFYFGYMVHNYHFAVYGALLGGMEEKAMEVAEELESYLTETLFRENPDLTAYLESYSALKIHVLVRFGRWKQILEVNPPRSAKVMYFRSATIAFARGLAFANLGDRENARKEADRFDSIRNDPLSKTRILHNNVVHDLLAVDSPMLRGEILYHEGRYQEAFQLLRKAVDLQDNLNYDEPWGKMQPIRHALGGLLLQRGHLAEAVDVFRTDLRFHPKNPFALIGLIQCLERELRSGLLTDAEAFATENEVRDLRLTFDFQRTSEWADFDVTVSCACCSTNQAERCCT